MDSVVDRAVRIVERATAKANSNVALAKYWGKRDEVLNLPYTGSISVSLAGLSTTVGVEFGASLAADSLTLNGSAASEREARRITSFLDLVRQAARSDQRAQVDVRSNFPVAAGLASSASTFAAMALAATRALGLSLSPRDLSVLARRGSGSAARSIFGGYVEWFAGESSDGTDSFAEQLAPPEHWRLGVAIAITDEKRKKVGSREGMMLAAKESPFFPAWLESHDADLDVVRRGIRERDLVAVGQAAERNCLKMHAVAIAANPPLLYWTPSTLAVIRRVWRLREEGIEAFFSIDAGPQVKVLCPWAQRATVADALGRVTGVLRVLLSEPGGGVELVGAA
ncbi:MAG TPA: diphosphomevalonate decarboxylase [Candidatus Kryptonia bacterium]|nr:diphosphomevalonate decarboxylase [Candidatus Kryptonia bacterium]